MSVNKIAQELIMVVNHGSTRRIGAQHKYCATEKLDRRKKKRKRIFCCLFVLRTNLSRMVYLKIEIRIILYGIHL